MRIKYPPNRIVRILFRTNTHVHIHKENSTNIKVAKLGIHVAYYRFLPWITGNGVARIFFWGGAIFRDLRRPTRFGGGGVVASGIAVSLPDSVGGGR